jgi:predicted secreted protein
MATNGTDVLLLVNDSLDADTPTIVGGQRDLSISEATETIDVSDKANREQAVIGGRYSSELTLDALWLAADDAFIELENRMRDGDPVTLRTTVGGTNDEEATGVVTAIDRSYPDQGASVVSCTVGITGAWAAL